MFYTILEGLTLWSAFSLFYFLFYIGTPILVFNRHDPFAVQFFPVTALAAFATHRGVSLDPEQAGNPEDLSILD